MARIIKNSLGSFLIVCFVFLIITGWIFSGWPRVWQNPSIPPKVQEAQAAETLTNGSFTGNANGWTLSVTTYDTAYQDSEGSIITASLGRKNKETGLATHDTTISVGSSDTVTLSLYWQKTWTTIASELQDLEVQILKPSGLGDWATAVTIWSETTVYQGSGWIYSSTDVSAYFDETGDYGYRYIMNLNTGNSQSAETHAWFDNTSLDVAAGATVSCTTEPASTGFGTLTTGSIHTATSTATTTMSCTYGSGCTLYVKDEGDTSNPGLYNATATDVIDSATETLTQGTEGYGIQVATTSAGTGTELELSTVYFKTGNDVGALALTNQELASSTATFDSREVVVTYKATISGLNKAGNYTDTITYECIGN